MIDETILDDEKRIKEIDQDDMYKFLVNMPESFSVLEEKASDINIKVSSEDFNNIIICGMGGSAIGGNLIQDLLFDKLPKPIFVNRGYNLPAFVDNNTLMITISYSGNTEETISAFQQGIDKKCKIIAISSNGKLIEYCERLGIDYIKVPSGIQPRAAISYIFMSLLIILKKTEIYSDFSEDLHEAIIILKNLREELLIKTPISKNIAKMTAKNIFSYLPLIYAPSGFGSLARRMKCQINENSKSMASWDEFSELNHNTIVGLQEKSEINDICCVILLRTQDEDEQIRNRIEITKEVIFKEKIHAVYEIWSKGKSKLAKMLSLLYIGDFISYYLAILKGINPTPVQGISELKKRLKEKLNILSIIEK
ncbi:MAG: bifunctional phosphoglucose/phosphomannose isomerase, partial [Candidatus Helarchaeota archaeon]